MKKSKQARYAYMAGLIDGEGCLSVRMETNSWRDGCKVVRVRLRIGQKDGRIIDWLYGNFGGNIKINRDMRREGNSWYVWEVESKKLQEILKKCLPFFVFKKRQAELAIQMLYIKSLRKGSQKYTPSQWLKINSIADEIQKLHHVYSVCAALETKSSELRRNSEYAIVQTEAKK